MPIITTTTTRTTRTYHTTGGGPVMGEIALNTRYLSTNRGIIKIAQVVIGFIICSMLCTTWYGGKSCFGEGRVGFASGLNFVCVVINIVLFILNVLNIKSWGLERIYSAVCTILFLIAVILLIWFVLNSNQTGRIVTVTVLIGVEFLLFLWDLKILQGEASN
ncbi:unnamed protein product [Caenorhabditis angaria]|uniref:MARVEL domain-containing protein n=1 Tax=Caenorhabditis angaria TaxID=860376 RepID=A0A9P1IYN7_9PELO|nr:unnamed protein product [Caenorhabditis angaria]